MMPRDSQFVYSYWTPKVGPEVRLVTKDIGDVQDEDDVFEVEPIYIGTVGEIVKSTMPDVDFTVIDNFLTRYLPYSPKIPWSVKVYNVTLYKYRLFEEVIVAMPLVKEPLRVRVTKAERKELQEATRIISWKTVVDKYNEELAIEQDLPKLKEFFNKVGINPIEIRIGNKDVKDYVQEQTSFVDPDVVIKKEFDGILSGKNFGWSENKEDSVVHHVHSDFVFFIETLIRVLKDFDVSVIPVLYYFLATRKLDHIGYALKSQIEQVETVGIEDVYTVSFEKDIKYLKDYMQFLHWNREFTKKDLVQLQEELKRFFERQVKESRELKEQKGQVIGNLSGFIDDTFKKNYERIMYYIAEKLGLMKDKKITGLGKVFMRGEVGLNHYVLSEELDSERNLVMKKLYSEIEAMDIHTKKLHSSIFTITVPVKVKPINMAQFFTIVVFTSDASAFRDFVIRSTNIIYVFEEILKFKQEIDNLIRSVKLEYEKLINELKTIVLKGTKEDFKMLYKVKKVHSMLTDRFEDIRKRIVVISEKSGIKDIYLVQYFLSDLKLVIDSIEVMLANAIKDAITKNTAIELPSQIDNIVVSGSKRVEPVQIPPGEVKERKSESILISKIFGRKAWLRNGF